MNSANKFLLDCLDLAEAKILFRENLGNRIQAIQYESPEYIRMEEEVLKQSGGLPKVITRVAEVWLTRGCEYVKNILGAHSLTQLVGVRQELEQSFKLCCSHIDGNRKNFFLLCSLYQTGTDIAIEDLIRFGIGLNIFGSNIKSLDEVINRANLWIKDLKSYALLERKEDQGSIMLHHPAWDFVCSVAYQDNYVLLLDATSGWKTADTYIKFTIISISMSCPTLSQISRLEMQKLKALIIKGDRSSNLPDESFAKMQNLRVLNIFKMRLKTLPSSIHLLEQLLVLQLEDCDIEDMSLISKLLSLKVLGLRGSRITSLTGSSSCLNFLKLLDVTCCTFGRNPADVIKNFSQLEGLYMFGSSVNQATSGLANLASFTLDLMAFKQLKVLEIEIPSASALNEGDLLPSVPESLSLFKIAVGCNFSSPHREFQSFSRVLLLKATNFGNLFKLNALIKRTECLSLTEIGGLKKVPYDMDSDWDLKSLHIGHCSQIECIVNTVGLSPKFKVFPELKILYLENLASLVVICHGRTPHNLFHDLLELKLFHLPQLSSPVYPIDHASRLTTIEIRDCTSLKYVFVAPTVGTQIDYLPSLKKLNLQGLPILRGLWENSLATNPPALFYKIKVDSLEELYLGSLDNISELWDFTSQGIVVDETTFSKLEVLTLDNVSQLKYVWRRESDERSIHFFCLKNIYILKCDFLESVFPTSILATLSQLESVEITSCCSATEVVMAENGGISSTDAIIFNKLYRLKLEKLENLLWFYNGNCTLEFPSLHVLILSQLPKMETFVQSKNMNTQVPRARVGEQRNTPQNSGSPIELALFNGQITFPSLEHLELVDLKDVVKLVEDGRASVTFPELKTISVRHLSKLKSIPQPMLENLEALVVHGCDVLDDLFDIPATVRCALFKKLELVDVENLKQIPWEIFPNLQTLVIQGGLPGLKSLVSTALLMDGEVLQNLETMSIKLCNDLIEIVSKECFTDENRMKMGTIMFPQLKHIKLRNLPSMHTFSAGNCGSTLLSLEKVEIYGCPAIVSFSCGGLITPKLNFVQLNQILIQGRNLDLNTVLKPHEQGMPFDILSFHLHSFLRRFFISFETKH